MTPPPGSTSLRGTFQIDRSARSLLERLNQIGGSGCDAVDHRAKMVLSAPQEIFRASNLPTDLNGYMHLFMSEPDPSDIKACARDCAAANVRRASRAITRHYGQFMASTGLEATQYSLLVACSMTRGDATVSELAEAFAMDRSALARNLAVMEKRGLVKVKPGDDRRTRRVALTPFGSSTLVNAMSHWREAQSSVETKFGADRLKALLSELRALAEVTAES